MEAKELSFPEPPYQPKDGSIEESSKKAPFTKYLRNLLRDEKISYPQAMKLAEDHKQLKLAESLGKEAGDLVNSIWSALIDRDLIILGKSRTREDLKYREQWEKQIKPNLDKTLSKKKLAERKTTYVQEQLERLSPDARLWKRLTDKGVAMAQAIKMSDGSTTLAQGPSYFATMSDELLRQWNDERFAPLLDLAHRSYISGIQASSGQESRSTFAGTRTPQPDSLDPSTNYLRDRQLPAGVDMMEQQAQLVEGKGTGAPSISAQVEQLNELFGPLDSPFAAQVNRAENFIPEVLEKVEEISIRPCKSRRGYAP